MSSFAPPSGTFPLVFESGVINLDEDGVLHVHLTHSPDNPHPMLTHPEGEETTIPANASEVHLDGIESEEIKLRCGIRETDTLPSGFVFHIVGWRLLQLEMSGDLTVIMGEMHEIPNWFQDEKVHRFDGPDEGVQLYKDSQPLSKGSNIRTPNTGTARAPTPSSNASKKVQEDSTYTQNKNTHQASKSGCGLLLCLLGTAFCFGAAAISILA